MVLTFRFVSAGIALVSFAGSAGAQCLDWSVAGQLGVGVDDRAHALAVYDEGAGPRLFVGGQHDFAGGQPSNQIARWDGTGWSTLGAGVTSQVLAMTVFDDGGGEKLIVGGFITAAGGNPASHVATWDGTSWAAMGSLSASVHALDVFDLGSGPELWAGGFFNPPVARWTGSFWQQIGGIPPTSIVYALEEHDDGSGHALYAGGVMVGSTPNVMRWDGTTWSGVGSDFDGEVSELFSFDDGTGLALYAGGEFENNGATPTGGIARWDGTSWAQVGDGFDGILGFVEPEVDALGTFDSGSGPELYAGGTFVGPNGPPDYVARWDGTTWNALGFGLQLETTNVEVRDFAVFEDAGGPALYMVGAIELANGAPANNIAKWFPTKRPGCSAPSSGDTFCFGDGSGTACPCGNTGDADAGCDNAQATGGAALALQSVDPDGLGGGMAVLRGDGFPVAAMPTVVAIRSPNRQAGGAGTTFADGLLCVEPPVVRVGTTFADNGQATLFLSHAAGAGSFAYQLWYRNSPATFCTSEGSNTSNGVEILWP